MRWQRRRILIWGKTRPEISSKYREIVCTGGVFDDTRALVRLYPIPLRYMDDEHVFKKYQWIEAFVARAEGDARPESYRIRADEIVVNGQIDTDRGFWTERAKWVLTESNSVASVETLQDQQKVTRRSLGILQPAEILDISARPIGASELAGFWQRYQNALAQLDLSLDPETSREIRPLTPSDYRFQIHFRCDDPRCRKHTFSVLDWEVDALYFRLKVLKKEPEKVAVQKVVDKLLRMCAPAKDVRFFLGNIHTHPQTFTIVGLWSSRPAAPPSKTLFD